MGRIVMVGGGIVGTCAAMMLAKDGHEVTVLERDPMLPPDPATAWDVWEHRGVNQFRQLHYFLPRFRAVVEAELPGLTEAMVAAGGLRYNPLEEIPAEVTGGLQSGDERFVTVTARRPVAEAVVATMAAATPGLTFRRGVSVVGVTTSPGADGVVHVTGVRTADGSEVAADLVVDCAGRRSSMGEWLRAAGSSGPKEMVEDIGFCYYTRHFRSADGSVPAAFGGLLQPYGSVSLLTLPADNGTWGVGIITSSKDAALRWLSDNDTWDRVVRGFPLVAHWIDGEVFTDVDIMTKLEDRQRTYVLDGVPVATGVISLADAWTCTNPSLGRGISIGLVHAAALRALLQGETFDDACALALRWSAITAETVQPLCDETLSFDRHRLAEIEAIIDDRAYVTDDPTWHLGQALECSIMRDPALLRSFLDLVSLTATGAEVFARPGVVDRAVALADPTPPPGPDRAQLLALIGG